MIDYLFIERANNRQVRIVFVRSVYDDVAVLFVGRQNDGRGFESMEVIYGVCCICNVGAFIVRPQNMSEATWKVIKITSLQGMVNLHPHRLGIYENL